MRNALIILAAVCEGLATLVLLPFLLLHRPAWLVRRLERLLNGIAVVVWVVRYGR